MKSSRMKFAKKLKSISRAGEYLNQDRILLQVLSAADGISEFFPKISNHVPQITSGSIWKTPQKLGEGEEENVRPPGPVNQIPSKPEISSGSDSGTGGKKSFVGDEENIQPPVNQIPRASCDRKENKPAISCGSGSGFRRPDLNSSTLFDPRLLEAFELAVGCFRRINELSSEAIGEEDDIVFPEIETEEKNDENTPEVKSVGKDVITLPDPFSEFEQRCPPGGEQSVVFYTTTLRGIRKTFDDCNKIRFLLDSFKVKYYERDVSMHRQYREELRRISPPDVLPPVLFVKGRCIGGAQRVIGLHEQGKFKVLFDGVSLKEENRCRRCDGFRFLMCGECRGSRRIVGGDGSRIQCLVCNENGLIVCVDCSS